jgi:Flp pilus assembly pilin Flp
MKNMLRKLWKDQGGQDLTEYALLIVMLVLGAAAAIPTLATAVNGVFTKVAVPLNTGGGAGQ